MTAFGAPTGAHPDRRARRVRRRHARIVLEAAHRRAFRRRPHARVGRDLGPRPPPTSSSRTATSTITKGLIEAGRVDDRRRGTVLARLPAQGRRRGDQRRHPHVEASPGRSPPRVRARRLSRSKGSPRASSTSGASTRRPTASAGCRSTRARPTARRSTSRPRTCASKATGVRLDSIDIAKSTGTRHRRRVGRRGTATIRSTPTAREIPVESLVDAVVPARAAVGAHAVHRHRHRHVRLAALRRAAAHRRPVRRRRGHRPGHRPALAARRAC